VVHVTWHVILPGVPGPPGIMTEHVPPPAYRSHWGLPWRWWRHVPHLHRLAYLPGIGHVKCLTCWQPVIGGTSGGTPRVIS
jgi:hypothetical protein